MPQQSFFAGLHESHRSLTDLAMVTKVEMDPDKITELVARLDVTLRRHFEIEDKELYPTLLDVVDEWEDRAILLGAYEDHQVIMRLLEDLEKTPPSEERFRGKVHTLDRLWQHHMEEEENTLYEMARRYLGSTRFHDLMKRIRDEEKEQKARIGVEKARTDAAGEDDPVEARAGRQSRS